MWAETLRRNAQKSSLFVTTIIYIIQKCYFITENIFTRESFPSPAMYLQCIALKHFVHGIYFTNNVDKYHSSESVVAMQ